MCGIAGIVNGTNSLQLERLCLEMLKETQHRGPDAKGTHLEGNTIVGSNRLSILDLHARSNMPLTSEEGRYVLVFNGEIYNYKELKSRLLEAGALFNTESDTEVLLQWLIHKGVDGIPALDGMFAFAFWDKQTSIITLARDRSGIKPLYYYSRNGEFVFSSEAKSIYKVVPSLELDYMSWHDILMLGYVHGASTMFKNMHSLEPGRVIEVDTKTGSFLQRPFIDMLNFISKENWEQQSLRKEKEVYEELKTDLQDSIEKHMVSDVRLGVVCSGGVDSSLISAIAGKINPNIQLFHARVAGSGNEFKYADILSKKFNLKLNTVDITREKFIRNWVRVIYQNDYPSYHPSDIPMYLVCQMARENGHKVLLSGEGADELFGGYEVNNQLTERLRWLYLFEKLPGRAMKWAESIMEGYLAAQHAQQRDYYNTMGMSINRQRSFTLHEMMLQGHGKRIDLSRRVISKFNFLKESDKLMATYITERLFGHLQTVLMRNDKMGMLASVENRIPFLSNTLIEKWVGMPVKYKVKNNGQLGLKYMLKNMCKDYHIPEQVWNRKKVGFATPVKLYIQPGLEIFNDGFLENYFGLRPARELLADNFTDLYRFISMEIWGRLYLMNESVPEVEEKLLRSQNIEWEKHTPLALEA